MQIATTVDAPYLGVEPFQASDAWRFWGRDAEKRLLRARVFAHPITIVYGRTGVGKSSLLCAGLMAECTGAKNRPKAFYFSGWRDQDWLDQLREGLCTRFGHGIKAETGLESIIDKICELSVPLPICIFDQFEAYLDAPLASFEEQLVRIVREEKRLSVVIGIRSDRLGELDKLREKLPRLFDSVVRVGPLTREGAREAIEKPSMEGLFAGFTFETGLVGRLLSKAFDPDELLLTPVTCRW